MFREMAQVEDVELRTAITFLPLNSQETANFSFNGMVEILSAGMVVEPHFEMNEERFFIFLTCEKMDGETLRYSDRQQTQKAS